MKAGLFMMAALLSVPAFAGTISMVARLANNAETTVQLNGPVIGFKRSKAEGICHISIKDSRGTEYSSGYLDVRDEAICSIAKSAFLTGLRVTAVFSAKSGGDGEVRSIEVIRTGTAPFWPRQGHYDQKARTIDGKAGS